jgi:hypothetical protein
VSQQVQSRQFTEFSGIGGRVLSGTLSLGTILSGVALTIVLFSGWYFCMRWEMEAAATLYAEFVIAVALARYAMNGLYGEWQGTIFSAAGGSWMQAAAVGGRYLLLTGLWLVPLLALGLSFRKAGPELLQALMGGGAGDWIALLLLYILGTALTPPVFLIVSVSAEKLADVLSPAHWKRMFSGRLGDLFFIYVLYIGGSLVALVLCIPPTIQAFGQGLEMGVSVAAIACAALAGLSVNLLGRLCGFFAFGEPEPAAASSTPALATPHPPRPPAPSLPPAPPRVAPLPSAPLQAAHAAPHPPAPNPGGAQPLPAAPDPLAAAAALLKGGDLDGATRAFEAAVRADPAERKAVKGLMQIADARLGDPHQLEEAARIYALLLRVCAASPFADDMRRGLEEAERRLSRTHRPVG